MTKYEKARILGTRALQIRWVFLEKGRRQEGIQCADESKA